MQVLMGNWKSNLPDFGGCVWSVSVGWSRFPVPTRTSPKPHPASLCLSLSFSISLWVCPTWQASFSLCSTVTVQMANWFRLCENRHKDRNRQLRIAQGPLPPHLSFLLASFLSAYLHLSSFCLHTHPFYEWKRPVSSLLSVLSSSPGPSFPPSIRPWVLLLVASVWTVAVGGWRIALSERARAGPTCSACSDMDSEYSLWS